MCTPCVHVHTSPLPFSLRCTGGTPPHPLSGSGEEVRRRVCPSPLSVKCMPACPPAAIAFLSDHRPPARASSRGCLASAKQPHVRVRGSEGARAHVRAATRAQPLGGDSGGRAGAGEAGVGGAPGRA